MSTLFLQVCITRIFSYNEQSFTHFHFMRLKYSRMYYYNKKFDFKAPFFVFHGVFLSVIPDLPNLQKQVPDAKLIEKRPVSILHTSYI